MKFVHIEIKQILKMATNFLKIVEKKLNTQPTERVKNTKVLNN